MLKNLQSSQENREAIMTASESMFNPNKYGNAQGKSHHLALVMDSKQTSHLFFLYR
jgi:hypothetical protein